MHQKPRHYAKLKKAMKQHKFSTHNHFKVHYSKTATLLDEQKCNEEVICCLNMLMLTVTDHEDNLLPSLLSVQIID
jgi:hypothetical protein